MIRIAMGLTVVLSTAATAVRADVPLPPNLHYVDPIVRFEGVAKLSDYAFRLRFTTFSDAPTGEYRYLEVPEGKQFRLNAMRRLGRMQLLALNSDEFERRRKEDPSLNWLTDETPSVFAADVPQPPTSAPKNKPDPVTGYRVSLEDGKLAVTEVEVQAEKKAGSIGFGGTWISGGALALACAAIGLWAARYRRPATASTASGAL